MSIIKGIHHVSLKACEADFDRVIDFYTNVFGCSLAKQCGAGKDRAAVLDAGNGIFMEIFANGTPDIKPDGPIHHFSFATDDVDAAIKKITEAGGTVIIKPMDISMPTTPVTNARIGFVRGPLNELIEFYYER